MSVSAESVCPPIRAYGIIGDCHTAALIARDGSIDWYCPHRFDAPAVFCRILDARKGGSCSLRPARRFSTQRRYLTGTNILETTFQTDTGRARVLDFMPIHARKASYAGHDVGTAHRIVRIIEGVAGEVDFALRCRPTFGYAGKATDLDTADGYVVAVSGADRLVVRAPDVRIAGDAIAADFRIRAGERRAVTLSADAGDPDWEKELEETRRYWEAWSARCTYEGPYRNQVVRSALALKLLDYEPSGALVAAPTTSLPEEIGGVRNWDYRFTWLRDSALALYALHLIGYEEEAIDFFDWLEALGIETTGELQIMYTIDGGRELDERELHHLEGYRGSRPVRVGNAAARQEQLDIYGEVLDAAHISLEGLHHPIRAGLWGVLRFLADRAAERWTRPDRGIWEMRGAPRHFLHSKLMCWVALDRAIELAEQRGLEGAVDQWRSTRERIRATILTQGYDERAGAFTQALGGSALDASALVMPLVGFLPPRDPRVLSTMDRVHEQLTAHGLVHRYLSDDGLPGGEGTFALCSWWLVDNYALAGRIDEASALFERVSGYANDLGLMAEQIDPVTNELLGNFPQAFTHLGMIRSALHIAKAIATGAEEQPERPAERMDRTARTGAAGARRSQQEERSRDQARSD